MPSVYFDFLNLKDESRRQHIFDGSIYLTSPLPSVASLCNFARSMIEEAFSQTDPREAQFNLAVEEFVNIIGPLKSKFTNHLRTKEIVRDVLSEFGCDLDNTYFDVPRLRISTHGSYLTAGVGYAYGPHRDMWYLDFDIYTPTKLAIERFFSRIPKGGIVIFDELNEEAFPGETIAVMETLDLAKLRVRRFPFEPRISYAIIGD